SAIFFSKTQRTWEVAIATPIFHDASGGSFEGILVLTVDIGDFDLVSGTAPLSREQFLALIDARQGEEQGTILHHPLFEDLLAKQQPVPGELLSDPKYHVPRSLLEKHEDVAYHDPLGNFNDRDGLAKVYQRRWLAAAAPVLPPIGADEHSESGLMVVMQSDYYVVVQPARELGGQF